MMALSTTTAQALVTTAAARVREQADELSRLDAIAGDGDHGSNMSTAFAAAAQAVAAATSVQDVFARTAEAFEETVGGAAGGLLSAYFTEVGRGLDAADQSPADAFANALDAGAARVARIGRAEAGQKSMIDAMVPAAQAALLAADDGQPLGRVAAAAAGAARAGAIATADMVPMVGRAKYAPDISSGSPDPGSTTIAVMLEAWAAALEEAEQ